MLFSVFGVVFSGVISPRFGACQDPVRLRRLYVFIVGTTIIGFTPVVLIAWTFPSPLLWLLGGNYSSLESECVLVVATGCIGQITGVMWNLNGSKAWIDVHARAYIPVILVAQAFAAFWFDLTQFQDILIFNLVTAAAPIPVFVADAVRGMRSAHRPPHAIG